MCDWDLPPVDLPSWFRVEETVGAQGLLGKGGQACVYCVRDTRMNPYTGKQIGPVAIKLYPREKLQDPKKRNRVLREVLNHRKLSHKHIVSFRELRLTKNYLCLFLNYVDGLSLSKFIRDKANPLPEPVARWFFQQMVMAVDYCHKKAIVNRDISLENMLVDKSNFPYVNIVMCDLGLSRSQGSIDSKGNLSYVGKKGYVAPEAIIRLNKLTSEVMKQGDIYSCGICLYKMLQGYDKWPLILQSTDGMQILSCLQALVNCEDPPQLRLAHPVSEPCASFLSRILHPNPNKRATIDSIWSDPWFATDLPQPCPQLYNKFVCSLEYEKEHEARLQGEAEVQQRINLAGTSFKPQGFWF